MSAEDAEMYRVTANSLPPKRRRQFMARVVSMLGKGGQRCAEREIGWNRGTIRRGIRDLAKTSSKHHKIDPIRRTGFSESRLDLVSENFLTEAMVEECRRTAEILRGQKRRLFMARVVLVMGKGGQRRAERVMGWNRATIRRGLAELSGEYPITKIESRGRKRVENQIPNFLENLKKIIESDPNFRSSNNKVCKSLRDIQNDLENIYSKGSLPSKETIRRKVIGLGYHF